mmetsp:Transcript_10599/g.15971  ORF Transcript_10599/g.15971 Transcript_10599/m.15971 type:complete len:96 (-) Transcript_10599:99-386(-)
MSVFVTFDLIWKLLFGGMWIAGVVEAAVTVGVSEEPSLYSFVVTKILNLDLNLDFGSWIFENVQKLEIRILYVLYVLLLNNSILSSYRGGDCLIA